MQNDESPALFVPGSDEPERAWQALCDASAKAIGRPYADRKIFSLSYAHDGIEYEARVGEVRQATEYPRVRGQRDYNRAPRRYPSGNVVIAILAGDAARDPYVIWEMRDRPSPWENPALVGPESVRGIRDFG